ncbi:MAG: transposase [Mangrovibacterium sp.]
MTKKDKGEPFYADSAYTGEPQEKIVESKEMINCICEKGYRNNPLTKEQKDQNTEKSRICSRVEHIFGFMENSMNGMYLYNIGLKRITVVVGLMNLTHNMYRKLQLQSRSMG